MQLPFMYVWSEVLFIPLTLAAYACLQQHLEVERESGWHWLAAMLIFLVLASYTRYVGVAFFGAAAIGLVLYGRGELPDRLKLN